LLEGIARERKINKKGKGCTDEGRREWNLDNGEIRGQEISFAKRKTGLRKGCSLGMNKQRPLPVGKRNGSIQTGR